MRPGSALNAIDLSDRQRAWVRTVLVTGNLVWLGNGLYLQALASNSPALFWVADLLQWTVLPFGFALALRHFAGLGAKDYGFVAFDEHWMKWLGESVGVFVTAGLMFLLARVIARIEIGATGGLNLGPVFPDGALLKAVVVIYWSATAAVVESALYVGLPWLLCRDFKSKRSRFSFVLITSALFAIAHWEKGSPVVIGAFVAQAVFCLCYFHYRSLWPIVGGHFLIDVVSHF